MTAAVAIESSVLGTTALAGLLELYDLEKKAKKWPENIVAFGLVIAWFFVSGWALTLFLITLKGGSTESFFTVISWAVLIGLITYLMKATGLLNATFRKRQDKTDTHTPIGSITSAVVKNADEITTLKVRDRVGENKLNAVRKSIKGRKL